EGGQPSDAPEWITGRRRDARRRERTRARESGIGAGIYAGSQADLDLTSSGAHLLSSTFFPAPSPANPDVWRIDAPTQRARLGVLPQHRSRLAVRPRHSRVRV